MAEKAIQGASLKRSLNAFHLWGIAVGLVISGEYFGWSYGWASAGTLGFLVTTAFVALVYLTYNPRIGRLDSERNCISNVRPEGLTYEKAAFKMAWFIQSAFSLRQTGIALKDESDLGLLMG